MPITPRMMLRIVILSVPHHAWLCFCSYWRMLYSQPGLPTPPEWIATISRCCRPVSKMYNLVQKGNFMVHSGGGLSYYLAEQMRSKLLRTAATGCRTSGTVHSTVWTMWKESHLLTTISQHTQSSALHKREITNIHTVHAFTDKHLFLHPLAWSYISYNT